MHVGRRARAWMNTKFPVTFAQSLEFVRVTVCLSEKLFPESAPSKQTHSPSAKPVLKSRPSVAVLGVQPPQQESQSPHGAARQAAAAGLRRPCSE